MKGYGFFDGGGILQGRDQSIVIVSGGRLGDLDFFRKKTAQAGGRLLIACDGGARHLTAAEMTPDVVIGDMDSLHPGQLADFEGQGVKMIQHPTSKNFTDTALALDYALGLKPKKIDIWGAQGGRLDHTLANIHLLIRGKEAGIPVRLVDEYAEVRIAVDEIRFVDAVGCLVSLIALSPVVEDVTLEGFEYALTHECLTMGESRGISNVMISSPAFIRVGAGNLLVIRYWQQDVFPEV